MISSQCPESMVLSRGSAHLSWEGPENSVGHIASSMTSPAPSRVGNRSGGWGAIWTTLSHSLKTRGPQLDGSEWEKESFTSPTSGTCEL